MFSRITNSADTEKKRYLTETVSQLHLDPKHWKKQGNVM